MEAAQGQWRIANRTLRPREEAEGLQQMVEVSRTHRSRRD